MAHNYLKSLIDLRIPSRYPTNNLELPNSITSIQNNEINITIVE